MQGTSVQRGEDPGLLTGEAQFTDDIEYPRQTYLAIIGSQYGHAELNGIDTEAAEALPGVLAVYTYDDLIEAGLSGTMTPADLEAEDVDSDNPDEDEEEDDDSVAQPLLANEKVTYQGQPVAAVVATERYTAFEAADRIEVDYERLDAVTDMETARASDAPTIHEAAPDNVAVRWETGNEDSTKDAFDEAAHTVSLDVDISRIIPTAMEPRSAVAQYRPTADRLVVELSSQNPHSVQSSLSEVLGLEKHRITVRVPSVGGGFGAKLQPYSGHLLAAWCSMQLERPVKWTAKRTEDFQSMIHGRRQETAVEAALDDQGRFLALRAHIDADVGGYPTGGGMGIPKGTGKMLCGAYDIPVGYVSMRGTITNTAPISAYRGAGRPEASYIIERVADACAREVGIDPAEFRQRNFIQPEDFPIETALGVTYDSGEYEKALEKALELVDYESVRERQSAGRPQGRYIGVGISSYVEICGGSSGSIESGVIRVNDAGEVTALTGTQDTGQGHATTYAQVIADALGIPLDDIDVVEGDTDKVTYGGGTAGSRSLPMAGNALQEASHRVAEKARAIAAHQLEASPEDVTMEAGEFQITGAPTQSVSFEEVAAAAYDPGALPDDIEPGLEATVNFEPQGSTAPFGTHIAVVEVDVDTGEIEVERYVTVDDVGPQVNPKLVEGQILGGVAQGIGQARYEDGQYDDTGNLVTGSLQDYAVPKSFHIPEVESASTVTPSPNNPLGVKGVGEAGTIGSTPTLVNAVIDALSPLGIESIEMPLTQESVWRTAQSAVGD